MAGYIPREQLQAYTRWEADEFGMPHKPAPPEPEPEPIAPAPPAEPEPEIVPMETVQLPTAEDIERIHNEAHQSGYEAGYEAGLQAGQEAGYSAGEAEGREAAMTTVLAQAEQLQSLCKSLDDALATLDQEMAESLLACSLEIARQLTRSSITARPEILLPIIREAMAALPLHHGAVILKVHPDQAELVQEHLGEQFSHSGWRIQADAEIEAGGCKVEAGSSEIDATLPTRWRRTLEAIGVTPEWLEAQP